MSVRKVSGRGGNIIGRFASLKLGRMVDFESLIERDLLYLLDFEADVTWFAEQPFTIEYEDEGKMRKYTPDFHVNKGDQTLLIECKSEKYLLKSENQRKFAAGQAYCIARSWTYQVMTDTQIRSGFRLSNVRLLAQFARYEIAPEIKARIRASLGTSMTIAELMASTAPDNPPSLKIPIFHMAFHHELTIPLDNALISNESQVSLAGGN